jgi:hypothetical protein
VQDWWRLGRRHNAFLVPNEQNVPNSGAETHISSALSGCKNETKDDLASSSHPCGEPLTGIGTHAAAAKDPALQAFAGNGGRFSG